MVVRRLPRVALELACLGLLLLLSGCSDDGGTNPTPMPTPTPAPTPSGSPVGDMFRGGALYDKWWTINGGVHSPVLASQFGRLVVEYLLSHPKAGRCATDLDGSGDTSFADLLSILAAWGRCDGCPQDLDASGEVGFADLLAVLSAWGPCT